MWILEIMLCYVWIKKHSFSHYTATISTFWHCSKSIPVFPTHFYLSPFLILLPALIQTHLMMHSSLVTFSTCASLSTSSQMLSLSRGRWCQNIRRWSGRVNTYNGCFLQDNHHCCRPATGTRCPALWFAPNGLHLCVINLYWGRGRVQSVLHLWIVKGSVTMKGKWEMGGGVSGVLAG